MVPPTVDVYVRIRAKDSAVELARFVDRFVDVAQPGDPRFDAFMRTFVSLDPAPQDAEMLKELRRDESASSAFSLYLRAKAYEGAIITVTHCLTLHSSRPNVSRNARRAVVFEYKDPSARLMSGSFAKSEVRQAGMMVRGVDPSGELLPAF